MSRFGPSFTAASTRRLRWRGPRGALATVLLTRDAVGLVGADGGGEAIPLGRLALAILWWRTTWPREVRELADLDSLPVDP